MILDELTLSENKAESDYQFADGDLSGFQAEFAAPKQDMNIDEEPEDFEDPEDEELNEDDEQPIVSTAKMARRTAKFITRITDQGAAFGLSLVSKNNIEKHKADKASLHELENIIAEYCKDTGGNIPLWMQLLICLVTMYGFQVPQALEDRKLNTERAALENERKSLEIERKNYEQKMSELADKKKPENGTQNN